MDLSSAGNWKQMACSIPGGWPSPLTFAEYCHSSKEAMVLRDSAFLEYLGAQSFAFKSLREWPLMEDGQSELLKRLEGSRTITSHLPASFLQYLLNPEQGSTTNNPLPNAERQDLDLALLFASLWMLEQGSYMDINLRIQWLGQLTGCLQGSLDSVNRVVAAMKQETAHPLSQELSFMWEKYSQERENHDINTVSSLDERLVTLSNVERPESKDSLKS